MVYINFGSIVDTSNTRFNVNHSFPPLCDLINAVRYPRPGITASPPLRGGYVTAPHLVTSSMPPTPGSRISRRSRSWLTIPWCSRRLWETAAGLRSTGGLKAFTYPSPSEFSSLFSSSRHVLMRYGLIRDLRALNRFFPKRI